MDSAIEKFRAARAGNDLTLYLGAGVSMGSGLPSWDALVLAMYFKMMDNEKLRGWRPFPNYLLAIAEWQLKNLKEPLEITARKIRKHYHGRQEEFQKSLWETLYTRFNPNGDSEVILPPSSDLRDKNSTLDSIVRLCCGDHGSRVKSVVTYNYDSLLEAALEVTPNTPIWNNKRNSARGLPIYHVHGYVPCDRESGSDGEEIVFTEDQYNRVANDPYSWANLIQIHSMSSGVGLMIGLSLADRNIRRLFDAFRSAGIANTHFALLQRPTWKEPDNRELDKINAKALENIDEFAKSGVKRGAGKKGSGRNRQIVGILRAVQEKSRDQETEVLKELGIEPIWYNTHKEIPEKLKKMFEN